MGTSLPSASIASEDELLSRARGIGGRTLAEIAASLAEPLPVDPRRAKGFVGELVERALGVPSRTGVAGPDVPSLGLEIKTIPVRRDGRPRESTFVCTLALGLLPSERWDTSRARAKLARVLWVPIEHDRRLAFGDRRVGSSFVWSPSPDEEEALREDWERVQHVVALGRIASLDARVGSILQVCPKARDGVARVRAAGDHDAPVSVMPRGFYLRASFTRSLVERSFPRLGASPGRPPW